jgi:hypothetical protein
VAYIKRYNEQPEIVSCGAESYRDAIDRAQSGTVSCLVAIITLCI